MEKINNNITFDELIKNANGNEFEINLIKEWQEDGMDPAEIAQWLREI